MRATVDDFSSESFYFEENKIEEEHKEFESTLFKVFPFELRNMTQELKNSTLKRASAKKPSSRLFTFMNDEEEQPDVMQPQNEIEADEGWMEVADEETGRGENSQRRLTEII